MSGEISGEHVGGTYIRFEHIGIYNCATKITTLTDKTKWSTPAGSILQVRNKADDEDDNDNDCDSKE